MSHPDLEGLARQLSQLSGIHITAQDVWRAYAPGGPLDRYSMVAACRTCGTVERINLRRLHEAPLHGPCGQPWVTALETLLPVEEEGQSQEPGSGPGS